MKWAHGTSSERQPSWENISECPRAAGLLSTDLTTMGGSRASGSQTPIRRGVERSLCR